MTAAGTAYAAIPDANGVIHGCYNVLTGSAKIVDGNNCGFFEKAITWQQTGPRGATGATGAQGQQGVPGPAGVPNVVVGEGNFQLPLPVNGPSVQAYDEQVVEAPSNGFCALTVSGTMLEATGEGTFRVSALRDDGNRYTYGQTAYLRMWDQPNTGSDIKFESSGTIMDVVRMEAGHTYTFGVSLQNETPVIAVRSVNFRLAWFCRFDG